MLNPERGSSGESKEKLPPLEEEREEKLSKEAAKEPEELEPSIDNIAECTRQLRQDIERIEAEQVRDVQEKIADRESLIDRARETGELLVRAQEALNYFKALGELKELKDPKDIQKIRAMEDTVASLEKQSLTIDRSIEAISKSTRVEGKLYEEAKKEDIQRTSDRMIEDAEKQLHPAIKQLAEQIQELAGEKEILYQREKKEQDIVRSVLTKIKGKFSDTVSNKQRILGKKSDLRPALENIRSGGFSRPAELKQELLAIKASLGFFKAREKAVIDSILSNLDELFTEYGQLEERMSALRQEKSEKEVAGRNLLEEYKEIILKSWETQNQVNELAGVSPDSNTLPSSLRWRLHRFIESFAGLKHYEGNKQVGKYESWYEAIQKEPGNEYLYKVLDGMEKEVDSLVFTNPTKAKERG